MYVTEDVSYNRIIGININMQWRDLEFSMGENIMKINHRTIFYT